jgi:excisionase family DNA binding protein
MSEDIKKTIRQASKGIEEKISELKLLVLPADYYMDICTLSSYSGISARKLKDLIKDPEYPLPAYKVKGSIRIKKSEFEEWMKKYKVLTSEGPERIDLIVSDVIKTIKK